VCDETAGLKSLVTLVKDEAAAAKNKMKGSGFDASNRRLLA